MSIREKVEHEIQFAPCTVRDLKRRFGGDRASDRKVMEALDGLVHDHVVTQKQGVFFTVRSGRADKAIPCSIVKLGKTFGFAMRDDKTGDLFIPGRCMKGAMPGDKVLVEKFARPRVEGSDEGEVLAITERNDDLVGTVRRIDGQLKFVPDCCPVISMQIARDSDASAKDGDKVAGEILRRGRRQEDHLISVSMRFGSADEAKQCAKALLYAQDITRHFPDNVKDEAKKLENAEVKESDLAGRMDLRTLPIFTIDSAETKDIDDAISLKETSDGFELGVHIADVSHYVRPGSALDEEAFKRGTSVYYADQVVPMLPKQLSNGICSLNEQTLRLAFSCLMRLDKAGNLVDYRFVKSVIYSRVKGVYSEINALLAGTADTELKCKYADVIDELPAMQHLYELRAGLRRARGCMDIESGEVKLILDEEGRCVDVKKRTQGVSEAMIEEFMLLANQCAAHFGRVREVPFVYRVHEEPNAEKLERLHKLLQACSINDHFAKEVPEPKELSAILESVRGGPYQKIIHTGLLRCMSKAKYEEKPKGHYSLVLPDYAHFTSPIRRYPDLAIHRILTDMIAGAGKDAITEKYADFAREASAQASDREVIAMQIERSAEDCYKAEYARMHLGESYEGTISGVTQRGLFVELPCGVEGFVPAASLTPRGTLLTEGIRLSDPVSGQSWSLGDNLMVTIVRSDVNLGKIDFEAAQSNANAGEAAAVKHS